MGAEFLNNFEHYFEHYFEQNFQNFQNVCASLHPNGKTVIHQTSRNWNFPNGLLHLHTGWLHTRIQKIRHYVQNNHNATLASYWKWTVLPFTL